MEHALVFASIVLGAGVAFMLENLNRVLRSKRVQWHWAQPAFALLVLLQILSIWWGLAGRPDKTMTLGAFLPILYVLVVATLLSASAMPDEVPEEGISMGEYYLANRRYQWTLYALVMAPFAVEQTVRAVMQNEWTAATVLHVALEVSFPIVTIAMIFLRRWWQVAVGLLLLSVGPISWVTRTL